MLVPGKEARVSLVVYNLGAGAVRVRARVLGADGLEVSGGRLKLLEHKAGPPARLLASYDPPKLPAGEYTLQVVDRRQRRLAYERHPRLWVGALERLRERGHR